MSYLWGIPGGSDGKESACNAGVPLEEEIATHSMHMRIPCTGYNSWGHKESDTTERLTHILMYNCKRL